ncbi:uncharacterized protein QC764_702050 [Podospora pseudoanserina]|uniref:RING-type domain-containing protein n=1 Tax=Podospora pseudoanserina TaxID=2609844 RepID=A0ABR0HJU3_9PEZI|nr:hypothetical protein QC764_702050 [Podospora pseudoanserina]
MTLIRPGEGRRQEEEACCTCATLLSTISSRPPPPQDVSSEKQPLSDKDEDDQQLTGGDRKLLLHQQHHRLTCCARVICADCISKNPRFLTYCPYCQSSGRSLSSSSSPNNITRSLTPVLSDDTHPPPYSSLHLPPAYTPLSSSSSSSSSRPVPKLKQPPPQEEEEEEDILHFLTPHDSIPSLSLLYNLPPSLLRSYNSLPTDSLLHARRTLLIPASHLPKGAISHSPRPYEGEEEEARKGKIRRWMVATKEHDYDIAVTYLEGAGYDFHEAVGRYSDDVRWERENPMRKGDVMKQGKRKVVRGLVGGLLGG